MKVTYKLIRLEIKFIICRLNIGIPWKSIKVKLNNSKKNIIVLRIN